MEVAVASSLVVLPGVMVSVAFAGAVMVTVVDGADWLSDAEGEGVSGSGVSVRSAQRRVLSEVDAVRRVPLASIKVQRTTSSSVKSVRKTS